ncbi:DUF6029 family protein [Flavobacterium sp. JP2137]|uniref:DUF6029 family protein n=1 Tax=Flavobacterium sp. JP2137 TaxID=3414510 RepID=UPI003D2FA035
MKNKLAVLGFCIFGLAAQAQIKVGLESNSQWYIDDKKIKLGEQEAEERFRSNSYLKLDYDYKNWTFGAQLEGYMPKAILNYSPDYDKVDLGNVFARYNNVEQGIDVTAGHFYEQYGSGMLFRAWEDRQIGINNAIFGINAKFAPSKYIQFGGFAGKQRVGMGFDLSKAIIFGSNVEVSISELARVSAFDLNLGLSYVGKVEDHFDYPEEYNQDLNKLQNAFSTRLDLEYGNFHAELEYVIKQRDALVESSTVLGYNRQEGNAALINLGYSKKGMGLNVSLRRVENMAFYSERGLTGNIYNQGILNYVPALTKQYDYSLQNIYVYQSQYLLNLYSLEPKLGEIGGQFDFYYNFEKGTLLGGEYGTNLVLNGSYWAGLKAEVIDEGEALKTDFLDFGDKYYHDLGVEVRKKWSPSWSSMFMYLNQYYNSAFIEQKVDIVKSHIVSAETTYQFMDNKSIRLEAQHLWADKEKKNWVAGTVEFAFNSNWSVFGSDMYNYGNDDSEKRIHYYNAGISFTKGTTRVATSYGRQRGGLLCVGGVCRMVSEAAGLTVGISTSF